MSGRRGSADYGVAQAGTEHLLAQQAQGPEFSLQNKRGVRKRKRQREKGRKKEGKREMPTRHCSTHLGSK